MNLNRYRYYFKVYFSVTNLLIGINILVYLIMMFFSLLNFDLFSISLPILDIFGANDYMKVGLGEYYRLLTSTFLHANLLHILFNMLALYQIGNFLERIYGKQKFFAIYILSGIFASFCSFVISRGYSVGASGAIFALMGVLLVSSTRKNTILNLPISPSQILPMILINLLFSFSVAGIDIAAHIGGLISGVILAFLIDEDLSIRVNATKELFAKALFYVSLLFSLYLCLFFLLNILRSII